jgi:hypothetical protein
MSMNCPHCGQVSTTRTSKPVSLISKESWYQCRNLECGHTFVAVTEVVRTLSPSARPNPLVRLPISRPATRR